MICYCIFSAVSQSVCPEHPTEWTEDSSDKLTTISEPLGKHVTSTHIVCHVILMLDIFLRLGLKISMFNVR